MRDPQDPPVVWSIAGFDPSSGAGITADLMTFSAHGLFGCSAITALTAQSTLGVKARETVSPDFLAQSLATLQEDLPPAGIKVGMLSTPEIMETVARALTNAGCHTPRSADGFGLWGRPVVIFDPVLRSSSGHELYPFTGIAALFDRLLPEVDVITPNWSELAALTGRVVHDLDAAHRGARALIARAPHLHVVVTGGDQARPVDLLVSPGSEVRFFEGEHVVSQATHGTGCAFSSALLANLVLGRDLPSAVGASKRFVHEAIRVAPRVGGGKGPMNLLWTRPLPG